MSESTVDSLLIYTIHIVYHLEMWRFE